MRTVCLFFLALTLQLFTSTSLAEKLTLATVNWQPFYGEDLPESGFFAAVAKEAYKRAGYDMDVKFLPWKRALEEARKGKYDGLLGAYYNEDRANTFHYSDVVYTNDEVFIQNAGRGISFSNVDELKRYKVGGMRGAAQMGELRSMGFDIEETTDEFQSLQKLAADRVDLVIMGQQQLHYQLANNAKLKDMENSFEILSPPFKSYDLYCAITKKRPDGDEITRKFNAALKDMRADGTFRSILERFGQK